MKAYETFKRSLGGIYYPMSEREHWSNMEAQTIWEMSLENRYQNDENFRRWSDWMHHIRMMSGPACHQCMEIVALREHLP